MTTNEEKLLPDVIWVVENEDENISCDYVADKDKFIFTKSDNAVKYLRAEIAEELVEALENIYSTYENSGVMYCSDFSKNARIALQKYENMKGEEE